MFPFDDVIMICRILEERSDNSNHKPTALKLFAGLRYYALMYTETTSWIECNNDNRS